MYIIEKRSRIDPSWFEWTNVGYRKTKIVSRFMVWWNTHADPINEHRYRDLS